MEDINAYASAAMAAPEYNTTNTTDSSFESIEVEGINPMDQERDLTNCSNIYCYSDDLYWDMLLAYIIPDPFEWAIIGFYALVFIVGLMGNSLVCFAVWRNHHMRTVTNLFIVNLATADLLVILLCLPPTVLEDVTETWYMGNIMCKVVKYAQGVSISVSVLTLTAISVERFYAICKPMKFKATMRRARAIITAIWCISIVLIIPDVIYIRIFPHDYMTPNFSILLTTCRPGWDAQRQRIFQIFMMVALYIVPFCFMGFTYARIAQVLWSNNIPTEPSVCRRNGGGTMSNGKAPKTQLENQQLARRKVAKMLIAVVVMFALCFLPVHLINIIRYSYVLAGEFWTRLALVSHWLCYFNSAINPVIYNFMSAKFRQEFRSACGCSRRQNTGSSRQCTRTTRYGASTYTYKMASDTTQTEVITMNKMSSASDEGTEPEVTVKLYPTMYENANAV